MHGKLLRGHGGREGLFHGLAPSTHTTPRAIWVCQKSHSCGPSLCIGVRKKATAMPCSRSFSVLFAVFRWRGLNSCSHATWSNFLSRLLAFPCDSYSTRHCSWRLHVIGSPSVSSQTAVIATFTANSTGMPFRRQQKRLVSVGGLPGKCDILSKMESSKRENYPIFFNKRKNHKKEGKLVPLPWQSIWPSYFGPESRYIL